MSRIAGRLSRRCCAEPPRLDQTAADRIRRGERGVDFSRLPTVPLSELGTTPLESPIRSNAESESAEDGSRTVQSNPTPRGGEDRRTPAKETDASGHFLSFGTPQGPHALARAGGACPDTNNRRQTAAAPGCHNSR